MKRIVSAVPGRIRLRDPGLRERQRHERVRVRLADLDGVRSVEGNPATGSLLLRYDVAAIARSAMEARVEAAAAGELGEGASGGPHRPVRAAAPRAIEAKGVEHARIAPAPAAGADWEASGRVDRRGPPHSGRAIARRLNGYAKIGMLASLGASLGLAAAGAKRLHIATGGVYLALLGIHMAVHRRHLLK